MKRLNKNQLKEMLQKNKNFLKYNGSTNIDNIEEIYNPINLTYKYKVNNKIIAEYCENLGSSRRYYYLRITKVSA